MSQADKGAELLRKLLEQRDRIVEVAPGKTITVRRPPETQFPAFIGGVTTEQVVQACVGWSGFTEADVLGPSVGSSDPLGFYAPVCAELVRDNVDWVRQLAEKLVAAVTQHLDAREAAAKN